MPSRCGLLDDHRRDHRHDFLEHLASFLDEQLVGAVAASSGAARLRKPKLLRMLFENTVLSLVPRMSQCAAGAMSTVFDQHRGGDIAEDEVAVAVAPVEMAAGDLRADDQHAARVARAHVVRRGLDTERGGRARDVHVEAEPLDAQRVLDLDRHRGIGALHVRRGAQHRVDVGAARPALSSACRAAATPISAMTESSSLPRSGNRGHIVAGSSTLALSIT